MKIIHKATFYTLDLLLTLIPPPSHLIIDHCMCLLKFVLILGVFLNGAALQQKWPLPSSILCTVNRRKSGNACSYALQCCAVNCSGRGKRSAGRLTCSRRRSRSFRRKVECQYFFFDLFTCLLNGCLLLLILDWKSEESKQEFLFVWVYVLVFHALISAPITPQQFIKLI